MTKTLAEVRADLARAMNRYHSGAATSGAVGTLIDTNGLARYDEDEELAGALVHITSASGEAPEGEARRITGQAPIVPAAKGGRPVGGREGTPEGAPSGLHQEQDQQEPPPVRQGRIQRSGGDGPAESRPGRNGPR